MQINNKKQQNQNNNNKTYKKQQTHKRREWRQSLDSLLRNISNTNRHYTHSPHLQTVHLSIDQVIIPEGSRFRYDDHVVWQAFPVVRENIADYI